MKKLTRKLIMLLAIVIVFTCLATASFAEEGKTRANSATSYKGAALKSIMPGDSTIVLYGEVAKVTLYMSTSNTEVSTELENVGATRSDGQPMFVKFGNSIFVTDNKDLPVGNVYADVNSNKYDQLIRYKDSKQSNQAPDLKPFTNSDLAKIEGFPRWLKDDLKTTNQPNLVYWMGDSANINEVGENKFKNLRNLILTTAYNSDPSKAGGAFSVNNVLQVAMSKAKFDYKKDGISTGEQITLDGMICMPGYDYVHWLVVYEPVVCYRQDPNKMFFPSTGGRNFLLSATDAILANMKSGDEGYPSVVRFLGGNPMLTLETNYCPLCDTTWWGYNNWPHSNVKKASWCPLPCKGISIHYTGIVTKNRYPFSVNTPFVNAARLFTVKNSWLPFNSGHLFDKPTASIDSLITHTSSDVDNILHYGGYSLFVNGPKKDENAPKIPVYIRAVALNSEGYTFTTIPNISIDITTQNDISDAEIITKTDEEASKFINTNTPVKSFLETKYNEIKNGTFVQNIVTQTNYAPVPLVATGNVDYATLLKNFKLLPKKINGVTAPVPIKNFDISEYCRLMNNNNPHYTESDLATKIQNHLNMLQSAADSSKIVAPDGTITLNDGTKIAPESNISPNWNQFIAFVSTDPNISSLTDIDARDVYYFNADDPIKYSIPEKFAFKGEPIYITVVLSVVKTPIPVVAVPVVNVIKENELVKAMAKTGNDTISKVSVTKTCTNTNCPGYYIYSSIWGTYTVPCGHSKTISNAKNIIPKSLNVQPEWYWHSSMFNGLSRLSVLRPNGNLVNDGKTFVFNTTSSFTANNMNDAYNALTGYNFLVHRNADPKNDGSVKPLQLASYMNNTKLNSDYLNFINPYYGGIYPSAYNNPTGYFGYTKFDLLTSLNLPQNVTSIGYGAFCSGGSSNTLSIPSKLSGKILYGVTTEESSQFKTNTAILINKTIASENKNANSFATTKQYFGINPNGAINPMYLIQLQSDVIKFNPTFKMQYQDSNNPSSPFKDVWMLAAGQKSFISNDYIKIEVTKTNLGVTSPWSRDSEDKVDERGNIRTIPTAKSGNTIKATANGTTIQVDAYINLQDPNFVSPSDKTSVQNCNDKRIKEIDDMVTNMADTFKNNGVSFYSNMFQSTTSNTVHKVSSPSYFKDLTSKSELKLAIPVTSTINAQTKAYYVDINGVADYTTPSRTITLNGKTFPAKDKWEDINAVHSENVLNKILEKNGGVAVAGWYNEDYEGIIVVHKTYIITLNNLETTYAQIHPQHSDILTERNELAQQLKFAQGSEILIPSNQYGIGVEYRLPTLNINGSTFGNIVIPSKPSLFDIRGSIYDTK